MTLIRASIRELNIVSMCLLYSSSSSTAVAILYRNHDQRLVLSCHDLSVKRLELSSGQSSIIPEVRLSDEGTCHLIPITSDDGSITSKGVLAVGGDTISFFSCQSRDSSQKKRAGAGLEAQSGVSTAQSQIEWKYSGIAT